MRKGITMKKIVTSGLLLAVMMALAGCGQEKKPEPAKPAATFDLNKAKDGTYTAESSSDSYMGRGRLTVVIKDHKIVAADFVGLSPDGKVKDDTYGMTDGQIKDERKYKIAQSALKANNSYGAQLIETQKPGEVDAIAGATVSYDQFMETAQNVLEQAQK